MRQLRGDCAHPAINVVLALAVLVGGELRGKVGMMLSGKHRRFDPPARSVHMAAVARGGGERLMARGDLGCNKTPRQ